MITETQIADFAKLCEDMRASYFNDVAPNTMVIDPSQAHVGYRIGKRYAKLTVPNGGQLDGSVYAFIDMSNGDILKPASWNAPAKHARGNIANGLAGMGPYGPAYLR